MIRMRVADSSLQLPTAEKLNKKNIRCRFRKRKTFSKRVKEKQVKVLRDLVTVNRESRPECHWETGKAAAAGSVSQETCLMLVRG